MARDQIKITDLRVRAIIGTLPEERIQKQDVFINITLYTDHTAAASDNLNDAIDYRDIVTPTIELTETAEFFLIEKLALEVVKICLSDPRVAEATVSIEKPRAVPYAARAGVTVTRKQGDFS